MFKIVTVTFDFSGYEIFRKLTSVLMYSIKRHEPRSQFICHQLPEPSLNDRVKGFVVNTVKLNKWNEEIKKAEYGDHILFIDADTMLINPVKDVFNMDFDIAYTARTRSKWVVNGGVLFVKVNDKTKAFMQRYADINRKMFNDQKFHDEYRKKYGGMNQSAFGYILENESYLCDMKELPCSIWNSCGEDWPDISKKTRIIHINGQARKAIFGGTPQHETVKPHKIWSKYYEELRTDEVLSRELGEDSNTIEQLAGV